MRIKAILMAVFFASVCITASAQVPAYRNPGYKGSVGLATVWFGPGIETSHGFMINPHHYLGIGVLGAFVPPITPYFEEFIEYQVYITKKMNAPFLGLKAGSYQTWGINEEGTFTVSYFGEPRFGWNWALGPTYGLTFSAGVFIGEHRNQVSCIPSLHLAFEF